MLSSNTLKVIVDGLVVDSKRLQHLLHQTAHLAAVTELTFFQAQIPPFDSSELIEDCSIASALFEKIALKIQENLKPEVYYSVANAFLAAQCAKQKRDVYAAVADSLLKCYDEESISTVVEKITSPKQTLIRFMSE